MLKVGIAGYGVVGRKRAECVSRNSMMELVAVCDRNIQVDDLSNDIRSFNNYKDMLNEDIDVLFVCLTNDIAAEVTIAGLERGLHVFCEKPPGKDVGEILEVIEIEKCCPNQKLMYGFNHRHHGSVAHMKEIIENQSLGKILWMRGRYGKEVDENYLKDWRVDPTKSGGGIMLDQGIHMLDLILYLGGDFDEVKAFVSNLYWRLPDIEDNVFAIFKNSETGLCASLHSTMTQWRYLFSLELFLEKGALILNGLKTSSGAYGDEVLTIRTNAQPFIAGKVNEEEEIHFKDDISWDSEINLFLDAIEQQKKPNMGSSADAVRLMLIIKKIYENK